MHSNAHPIHGLDAIIEIVEMARDGAGAQQQPDLDERLSAFGHDGGAAALAVVRNQLEVRLGEIVSMSIDGQWVSHGRIERHWSDDEFVFPYQLAELCTLPRQLDCCVLVTPIMPN